MVYVRADGNAHIGMGHVMRTLSLAKALAKLDLPVCFLVSNEKGEGDAAVEQVKAAGFQLMELPYAAEEKDAEIPYLSKKLTDLPAVFLVDSYAVDKEYLEALGEMGKVIYLDDLCEDTYPVDGILNYNIYAEALPYAENYKAAMESGAISKATKFYLGPRFAPIREAFCDLRQQKKTEAPVRKVLFTTGGGDSLHILLRIAGDADKLFTDAEYHFLCGPLSEDREKLEVIAATDDKLKVHGPQKDMALFLNQFDLVVSAAGSTLYELCALGIPAIGFSFVDNQVQNLQGFVDKVGLPSAGAFDQHPDEAEEKLLTLVNDYIQHHEKRRDLAERMAKLVDGQGALRFAQEIEKIHEETKHS